MINLMMMTLVSSAPQIYLAIFDTVWTLGDEPGKLGSYSILGAAAFNFMVLTAISIVATEH